MLKPPSLNLYTYGCFIICVHAKNAHFRWAVALTRMSKDQVISCFPWSCFFIIQKPVCTLEILYVFLNADKWQFIYKWWCFFFVLKLERPLVCPFFQYRNLREWMSATTCTVQMAFTPMTLFQPLPHGIMFTCSC